MCGFTCVVTPRIAVSEEHSIELTPFAPPRAEEEPSTLVSVLLTTLPTFPLTTEYSVTFRMRFPLSVTVMVPTLLLFS